MILTGNKTLIDVVQPVNWLAPLNQGLVAWYMAVPGWGGGTKLVDLCEPWRFSRYGTLTNMDPITDWVYVGGMYSLTLDGSNDFVRIPTTPALCPSLITVSATARPTAGAAGGNQGVTSMSAATANGWALYRTGVTSSESVTFGIHSTTFTSTSTAVGSFGPLNRTYRVTGTYDGVNIRAYFDGTRSTQIAKTGNITLSTTDVAIGNLYTTGQYFPGFIDDVRIYNRALSDREVEVEYQHAFSGWSEELNRVDAGSSPLLLPVAAVDELIYLRQHLAVP